MKTSYARGVEAQDGQTANWLFSTRSSDANDDCPVAVMIATMKPPFRRSTIIAAIAGSLITFVLMAAMRPEPRTVFVTANQGIIGDAALAKVLPKFEVNDLPLRVAVQRLADQTHIPIYIHSDELWGVNLDPELPITIRLTQVNVGGVLAALLQQVKEHDANWRLTYWQADGAIQISTEADAANASVVMRVYDVHDLIRGAMEHFPVSIAAPATNPVPQSLFGSLNFPPSPNGAGPPSSPGCDEEMDALCNIIRDRVQPESWKENGGQIGSIYYWGGKLVVLQSQENQDRVAQLLQALDANDLAKSPSSSATRQATSP